MADTFYKVHHVTQDNVQSMTINFALLLFCKTQYVCLWRFRVFFSEMLCDKNLRLYFNEGINFYSRCMSWTFNFKREKVDRTLTKFHAVIRELCEYFLISSFFYLGPLVAEHLTRNTLYTSSAKVITSIAALIKSIH